MLRIDHLYTKEGRCSPESDHDATVLIHNCQVTPWADLVLHRRTRIKERVARSWRVRVRDRWGHVVSGGRDSGQHL